MLHPILIVSLRHVVSGVSSSGLFSVLSSKHRHLGLDHQVIELHSLDEVGVPDVASVADSDISNALGHIMQGLAANLEVVLSTENSGILLHSLLHVTSDHGSGGFTL